VGMGPLLGGTPAMREVFSKLDRLAAGDQNAVIEGESGTGKELAAQAVHAASRRAARPFVVCDVSGVAPSLVESELYGCVAGAVPGAVTAREGAFQRASGGTLLLDHIGDLDASIQPRLLRALER